MKIKVRDIMVGLIMGVMLFYIDIVMYDIYSKSEISDHLSETEFLLRENNVGLSVVTRNEEKKADLDDLSLYEILEETGKIKYNLKVGDKTYELQSIADKVVNDDVISLEEITDSRRKEISDMVGKFDSMWGNVTIFSILLGLIVGTFASVRGLI